MYLYLVSRKIAKVEHKREWDDTRERRDDPRSRRANRPKPNKRVTRGNKGRFWQGGMKGVAGLEYRLIDDPVWYVRG
jgi:hypothetical protein